MSRTSSRRPRLRRGPGVHLRLRIGFVLIAMVLSLFGARLVQLQGIDPAGYAVRASAEGTVEVVLPAERGGIVDRNGEPLAESVDGLMLIADPALTTAYAPELATLLSQRLDLDYVTSLERLRRAGSRFEYLARQVPASRVKEVVAEAESLGYKGLITRNDPVRVYPGRDVAANLVGFLGIPDDDGAASPLAGLELAFNGLLAGRDGSARYAVDTQGRGNRIPLGEATLTRPRDGQTLTTTIDRDLQWFTQRVLRDTVRRAGGESGLAVVLDSRTAEVLALADEPTLDASRPEDFAEELYTSRALADPYEPGSVEKVLTMAGLIDAGKMTPRTRFTVPGQLQRQDRPINDYFEHDTIRLTLAGILSKSSNIGTVLAADRYGPGELRGYLTDFGLGSRTGIGLSGETAGLLPDGAAWTSQTADRIAFGQSLSVNALQMAAAINTIANDGERIDPSLVRGSATTQGGQSVGTEQATRRQVVSEAAARQTSRMMERVVDAEAGVAPRAAVPGYRVAGKTGTAQRVGEDCGCYDGTFTVSFAGFAPADDPRFTIYVVVQNPRSGGGGSVAGPAFSELMGYTLRRYGVPPTGTPASTLPVEW